MACVRVSSSCMRACVALTNGGTDVLLVFSICLFNRYLDILRSIYSVEPLKANCLKDKFCAYRRSE